MLASAQKRPIDRVKSYMGNAKKDGALFIKGLPFMHLQRRTICGGYNFDDVELGASLGSLMQLRAERAHDIAVDFQDRP